MKDVNTLFVIILLKRDAGKHIEKKRQTDTERDRQTDRQTKISKGLGAWRTQGTGFPSFTIIAVSIKFVVMSVGIQLIWFLYQ